MFGFTQASFREIEEIELLRRMELDRCRERAQADWDRRVRRQVGIWKVDNIRFLFIANT
jgi:hypothetical protein